MFFVSLQPLLRLTSVVLKAAAKLAFLFLTAKSFLKFFCRLFLASGCRCQPAVKSNRFLLKDVFQYLEKLKALWAYQRASSFESGCKITDCFWVFLMVGWVLFLKAFSVLVIKRNLFFSN